MHLPLAPLALAVALALPAAAPAFAQSEEDVLDRIESIHGDSEGFFELFGKVQDAMMSDNPTRIAHYGLYPLSVNADGENYDVEDEQDFVNNFDEIVTPETLEAVRTQDVADLIVTSEGVGIGNGAMWITNTCLDDDCAETQWGILSINN